MNGLNKSQKGLIAVAIIVIAAAVIGIGSSIWLAHDNEVEEISEDVIKYETGVDIDLSPDSKENKGT